MSDSSTFLQRKTSHAIPVDTYIRLEFSLTYIMCICYTHLYESCIHTPRSGEAAIFPFDRFCSPHISIFNDVRSTELHGAVFRMYIYIYIL